LRELTELALDTAQALKSSYADIRIVRIDKEEITVKNGKVEAISSNQSQGFGIRVIVSGAWGFASSSKLDKEEVKATTALAVKIAQASAQLKKKDVLLTPVEKIVDSYKTRVEIDPFTIPLGRKVDLLLKADELMRKEKEIKVSEATMDFFKEKQIFASTEGSYIEQEIIESGAGIVATAVREGEFQTRSFPNSFRGHFATRGYEFIESMDLVENAERVASEARQLLYADPCPSMTTTLILDGNQLALQVHESIGHPIELDRVLGTEADYAGASFLTLDKLNDLQYGSDIVNVNADATLEGGLGSFGYDDEGVPSQRVQIIKDGLFVGYLTSRETASVLDQTSNGAMRADGWNRIPLIRMTNINLEPGEWTLEDMIADTDEGIYMDTNRSWSIDDKRLNFQFGTEIAWEIKNGKRTRMLKDANYTGITPEFWNSCDAIANKNYWVIWGTPNCGKGRPGQVAHVGHGTSPARFRNVRIGIK